MKYPKCKYCECDVGKMYKHVHHFDCGTSHHFYIDDHWSESKQCKIISLLRTGIKNTLAIGETDVLKASQSMKIMSLELEVENLKSSAGYFFTVINELRENQPLYKDSGLWQIRTDDLEEMLLQQGVNESFTNFIYRAHVEQQKRN